MAYGSKLLYYGRIMGMVYGDSTPFPYENNFIELIRDAVDCGVVLLEVQQKITSLREDAKRAEEARKVDQAGLSTLSKSLKNALLGTASLNSGRSIRVADRIYDAAQKILDEEKAVIEKQAKGEVARFYGGLRQAREKAFRALAAFLLRHELPQTQSHPRLHANERGYTGQVHIVTPFGVEAEFSLAIPAGHFWEKPRRVGDICAGTDVHIPQLSGWLSKRMEMQLVRLDKLFISDLSVEEKRVLLMVRKGPRAGSGYQIEMISSDNPAIRLRGIEEENPEAARPLPDPSGEDFSRLYRLVDGIINSSRDLIKHRQEMLSATFEGKSILEQGEPTAICTRLVHMLAPIVREIARRSGAPGELVLRRDLGEGRREEVYITKAELHEKILALPSSLTSIFDPLELSVGPRSPRAPAASGLLRINATNPGDSIGDSETNPTS